ncbi:UTP4 [Candida margitis]|uniref:UTP4 n=1 Tax=Candida margitis TaxID=1775924 RepID=UPI002227AC25|nr:UTP4 [Candida margitis]KAI5969049.1 UTP4 [Candida margitis]
MDIHRCRFVDYTPHTITSLAFSCPSSPEQSAPSDLRLAVGRSNGDIEIWNPRHNWIHELTLSGSKGRSIEGLVWSNSDTSNNGNEPSRLFSIGGSTYITEWDLKTGRPLVNYDCNAGTIWSIDVNSTGDKLAVGCDDGSVVVVDISGGVGSLEYDVICQRQDARVLSMQWNGNEQIIGGCADGRIRVWSYGKDTKGRILSTMRVDKSKTESTLVWTLNVLPKKNQLVSGDSTGHIKIWDLKFFSLMQSFKIHDADVLCIASDAKEERFFSAGIDRKIHQYDLLSSKSSSKWVHSFNRLLHSNDIRSMAIMESKSFKVLVSGGVEKAITIQPIENFQDSKYKKLLVNQQISNVLVVPEQKLVILYQDQIVKIWKILSNGKHKLISKLILSDDENITSVDFRGNLLAVAKMTSVKIYDLDAVDIENDKYMINKIRDENFDSMVSGAKKVKFVTDSNLLILTPDEELYQFAIDAENSQISLEDQVELLDNDSSSSSSSNVSYSDNIKNLVLTPNHKSIVISRFNGAIEVYPLNGGGGDPFTLTKLSNSASCPHLITCRNDDQLLVLTNDNKILEFNLFNRDQLLTSWSKRNSEFLPRQFTSLDDKPEGMFVKDEKLWVYGTSWMCYFDLTKNIPISKLYKNISAGKKRKRDGMLSLDDDVDINGDVVQLESSLKQSEIGKLKKQIKEEEEDGNDGEAADEGDGEDDVHMQEGESRVFSLTEKYRPIMQVAEFGPHELLIVERPYFALPTTPAFNLPKLRI